MLLPIETIWIKPHYYVMNCGKTLTISPAYAIATTSRVRQFYSPKKINNMKITNRGLGTCGMMAAPFLTLMLLSIQAANGNHTSLGGFFGLVYMLGWQCSIVGLLKMRAAGQKNSDNLVLYAQLALLSLANIWNVWVMIAPGNSTRLFFTLGLFWPLSNLFMLVVGVVIAKKAVLAGWRRYIVFAVGLWYPFTFGTSVLVGPASQLANFPSAVYSVIAWTLMGWLVYSGEEKGFQNFAL